MKDKVEPITTKTDSDRLKKELGLFDVYAVSTGAMFSSGFFLLPGLAAAKTGPSVFLAYLLSGILILPAMFSMAELSTAMPRAGGSYYFLDRSLGPLIGTIGGIGTWLALVFKSAFALIGIGAYTVIFIDLPIKPVAVALTLVFMAVNIVGAKESSRLQKVLVFIILSIMGFFTLQGLYQIHSLGVENVLRDQFQPFMPFGISGLLTTAGFVFVSYAGLTKVASVAEEIRNPKRNIPLGMILSLISTMILYVLGVLIMVAVLDPSELHSDLTPVATAGEAFFDWLPQPVGLFLIVLAAIAAFASTGNAGILSASRYPLAMARDRLIPDVLSRLGQFRTPDIAIYATSALMIFFILVLDVEGIVKLASAFQFFIFTLINIAVIVMRESKIKSYDPGYHSPFYPWMQIFGIIIPLCLVFYMGLLPLLSTLGVIIVCVFWYYYYARPRVKRHGAIFHWFARLGVHQYDGLDYELWEIMREKGLREEDPFNELITRATVVDLDEKEKTYSELVLRISQILEKHTSATADELVNGFTQETHIGWTPTSKGASLPNLLLFKIEEPELVLVRSKRGILVDVVDVHGESAPKIPIHAFFFLVSPEETPKQHLRILAEMAEVIDNDDFISNWLSAIDVQELKEILFHDERFHSIVLSRRTSTEHLIDKSLSELKFPEGNIVALIQRDGESVVPTGNTILRDGDRITIIGTSKDISKMRTRYSQKNSITETED